MTSTKKNVLFFARSGYHEIMCRLKSEHYNSFYAVINKDEKQKVEELGGAVIGCFEEMFDHLPVAKIPDYYLQNGYAPDRFLGWLTLPERQEILGKTISFWSKIIDDYHIDACVHETVSYEPEEVLTLVAKDKKIKDLNWLVAPINGYFFWKENPYNSSFSKERMDKVVVTDEIRQVVKQHIELIRNRAFRPDYMDIIDKAYQKQSTEKALKSIVLKIKELNSNLVYPFIPKKLLHLYWKLRGYQIESKKENREEKKRKSLFYYNDYIQKNETEFDKLIDDFYISISEYDTLKKYNNYKKVIYPLHFEPEATLLYFAPNFSDQIDTIQRIARNLPLDRVLVVKEHPSQPRYLLRQDFQKIKRIHSNLLYLPAELSSFELISDAEMIITVTGTLGWEALVMGKPTVVLGNVFYDNHPQVYKLQKIEELRLIFSKPLLIPNQNDTFEYLCKVMAGSYKGVYFGKSKLNPDNLQNIISSIYKEINFTTHFNSLHNA